MPIVDGFTIIEKPVPLNVNMWAVICADDAQAVSELKAIETRTGMRFARTIHKITSSITKAKSAVYYVECLDEGDE